MKSVGSGMGGNGWEGKGIFLYLTDLVSFTEIKSTGTEFEKKYKELVKLRQNYRKSYEVYDKKLQQYNDVLAHHEKIRTEMYHMKLKLQEVTSPNPSSSDLLSLSWNASQICSSELKEEVEVLLPERL
jgi:hypothetical protein